MRNQRTFSLEFKRQVVEELLSGQSWPAQVCRRYEISSSLLCHWKRQYARGKFNNEPVVHQKLSKEGGGWTSEKLVDLIPRTIGKGRVRELPPAF